MIQQHVKEAGPVQDMLFELPLREFDFPNHASARAQIPRTSLRNLKSQGLNNWSKIGATNTKLFEIKFDTRTKKGFRLVLTS